MPCESGGEVGCGALGAPCLFGLGRVIQGNRRASHDIKAKKLADNAVGRVGACQKCHVFRLGKVGQKLRIHISIEQQIATLLRDVLGVKLGHESEHIGLAKPLALACGLGGVSVNLGAGCLDAAGCGGRPRIDKRQRHLVGELKLVVAQHTLALVVAQLYSVGVGDADRVGCVLVEDKGHIRVGALCHGCRQLGAIFLNPRRRTRLWYMHCFALIYVLVGVKCLG